MLPLPPPHPPPVYFELFPLFSFHHSRMPSSLLPPHSLSLEKGTP